MGSKQLHAQSIMLRFITFCLLPSVLLALVVRDHEYNEEPSSEPAESYEQGHDESHHENVYERQGGYSAVEPLGDSTGKKKYTPTITDHYAPNEVYKAGDHRDCHFVDKIVYKDECIPYVVKTCYTQQKEECEKVFDKKCESVIDEDEDRECFEVTELLCSLVESLDYEVIQEPYTVQRCTTTKDRICDTVYDMSETTKDDFQCVDIENPTRYEEEKIIKDRTCIYSVDFECGKLKDYDGKHSVQCDKVPTKKCYDTPRVIKNEICKPKKEKVCEKVTHVSPEPVEAQNCHSEPMKTCELEQRQRPKKARVFNYRKQCKPVKRQVCEDAQKKKLRAECKELPRNVCTYEPEEKCVDETKTYCFKSEAKLHEKVCLPEKKIVVDETFSYV